MVVVYRFGPGVSSIGGGFSSWTYDFVAMSFFDPNALSVLPHELGHHFGLPHTFGMTFPTVGDATNYVLSGRPTEAWDGDRSVINDTPRNPDIVELRTNTTVDAVALDGQTFRIDRRNIMSYSSHGGTGILSHGQIDRVRQIVLDRRARYLDVTVITPIDCAALRAQIDAAEARRAELVAERDAETDPFLRRRLAAAIAQLTGRINQLRARARQAGCL